MPQIHFKFTIDSGKGGIIGGDGRIAIECNESIKINKYLMDIKQCIEGKENESVREGERRKENQSAIPQNGLVDLLVREIGRPKDRPAYEADVKKYSQEIILKAMHQALGVPSNKIKKSRGALFHFLLKKYSKEG